MPVLYTKLLKLPLGAYPLCSIAEVILFPAWQPLQQSCEATLQTLDQDVGFPVAFEQCIDLAILDVNLLMRPIQLLLQECQIAGVWVWKGVHRFGGV